MKKFLFTVTCIVCFFRSFSQTTTDSTLTVSTEPQVKIKEKHKIDLSNRSNDHFMFQFGADNWTGTNDSINPQGFSRFFNFYLMLDKPFKTNPKFSVGLGVGIGSSNMFFNNTNVDITATSTRLPFRNVDSVNHFKKFKLTTLYLEAPIELRYTSNPENGGKTWKGALGVKVGTMLKAYTKGKNLVDKNGNAVNNFIEKEYSKRYFNSLRLALTARVGYGIFSLYGAYQINTLLKDAAGPSGIRPYSIGICVSGL